MYDIEKLVGIVCDLLEAETEVRKYNLEIRKEKGYAPDACLWIPSLDGDKAYRRPVRIGRQNPMYYEVLEGLEDGERVIVSSYDTYGDNQVLLLK